MENDIKVNNDGSVVAPITYSPEDLAQMKNESDQKLAQMQDQIERNKSLITKLESDIADEQANNDKLSRWITQSNNAKNV